MKCLLLMSVVLLLATAACSSADTSVQPDTIAALSLPAATTSTAATTTTTAVDTTVAVLPPDELLATFFEATAAGNVETALASVVPSALWGEGRLTNLIEFFGALSDGPPFAVSNCVVVGTVGIGAGTGEEVSCDIALAVVSADASAAVGLPLVVSGSGVAAEGILSRVKPRPLKRSWMLWHLWG